MVAETWAAFSPSFDAEAGHTSLACSLAVEEILIEMHVFILPQHEGKKLGITNQRRLH
jgi:hypothetical protein